MIRNLAGSEREEPAHGIRALPVYNPATGWVIEEVSLSGPNEMDAAVSAAAAAFRTWSRSAVMERVRVMFRFKAVLEDHYEELAGIITLPVAAAPLRPPLLNVIVRPRRRWVVSTGLDHRRYLDV